MTFWSFAICFCQPSGSLVHKKMTAMSSQMESPECSCVWSLCLCCGRIFVVLAPFEAVTAPWSVQPNGYVDEETTQEGGGKGAPVCLCKRAHEGERGTGQLSHNTFDGTRLQRHLAHQLIKKRPVRLPLHVGLCCKRSVAILSALRACESWSIANPGRLKHSIFQSTQQY